MGRGERTREHILEQAAGLFNRKGFAGASMSDVMAATGLQKGGIYRHFESKEALAAEGKWLSVEAALHPEDVTGVVTRDFRHRSEHAPRNPTVADRLQSREPAPAGRPWTRSEST